MIKVVETSDKNDFERQSLKLMEQGYRVSSTYCGFLNSERYDFCSYYQAIFIKEGGSNGS